MNEVMLWLVFAPIALLVIVFEWAVENPFVVLTAVGLYLLHKHLRRIIK